MAVKLKDRTSSVDHPLAGAASTDIEAWLDEWSVEWHFVGQASPAAFDGERSLRNQARLGDPLDQDVVERYAEAMRGDAVFPAVVAWKAKTGYVVIDGNHRWAAARDAERDLAVYEVKARAQTITAMTFEANVRHGKPTSDEERVHHALYLIDNGMTQKEAAGRMAVPLSKVKKALQATEAQRRADSAGISRRDWEAIPDSARNRLMSLTTDEALVEAVKLFHDAGLLAPEVFDIVSKINDTKSTRQQLAILANLRDVFSDRIQDRKAGVSVERGKRTRSPKSALATTVGLMLTLPPTEVILGSLGEAEREEYVPRVNDAIKRLTELREALGAS